MNRTEVAPEKQPLPLSDSVMGGLKRVYFSSVFYTLVTSIEALTPFLLTPILTRFLSPASYGIVTQPSFVFVAADGSTSTHVGALGIAGLSSRISDLIDEA